MRRTWIDAICDESAGAHFGVLSGTQSGEKRHFVMFDMFQCCGNVDMVSSDMLSGFVVVYACTLRGNGVECSGQVQKVGGSRGSIYLGGLQELSLRFT